MSEYNIQMNKYNALNANYDQLYPKPMKHANTHASGGTDPITPGDIGVYSKSESDMLLAKKADASSVYTKEESISASTRTALNLAENATPDTALSEIARQLSEPKGVQIDLLWENASPSSNFPESSISIPEISNYEMVAVIFGYSTEYHNHDCQATTIMIKNQNQGSVAFGAVANQKWYVKRNTYLNDDSVGVADAYASDESALNNKFMIPLSIYGIK